MQRVVVLLLTSVIVTWYQSYESGRRYFSRSLGEEDDCASMEFGGRVSGLGVEALSFSNYKIWKTCMESYLKGEDLWEMIDGTKIAPIPAVGDNGVITNGVVVKEWATANAKTEFVLKRSISHDLFEHIMSCNSAANIWKTLDELLNKKNTT